MKKSWLRTSVTTTLTAMTVLAGSVLPAKAYYFYVWRQQTADTSERQCAQTAYRVMADAGYANTRFDDAAASGDRNGATINVNCIMAANGQIVAILYSIGDNNDPVRNEFELLKKAMYGRVPFDDNP